MLADRTYDEAKAFMVKNFPDARLTSSGKIVAGLRHFGIEPLATRCRSMNGKSIDQLECDAAVMVSHRRGQSRGDHWIVWDSKRRRILDPLEEGKPV
jgi:hypothetical protein